MKLILFFLNLFLFFFTYYSRLLPQAPEEIISSDRITEIYLEHSYNIIQNDTNITLKFVKPEASTFLVIQLKIKQHNTSQTGIGGQFISPLFILNKDQPAYYMQNENKAGEKTLNFNVGDINGYFLDKSYRFVVLDPSIKEEVWYASILVNGRPYESFQYELSTEFNGFKTCPLSCSNQGQCVSGQCQCNQNYLDADCSQLALQIKTPGKWNQVTLKPQIFTYIYYQIPPNLDKSIIIQFQKEKKDSFSIIFTIEGTLESELPNEQQFNQYFQVNSQDSEFIMKPTIVNFNNTRKMIIGLLSKVSPTPFNIKFQIILTDKLANNSDEEMQQIMTILGLACSVIVVLSCTFMCCICKKRNILNQDASHQNQILQQATDEKKYLELIDLYIPSKSFDQIKQEENIINDIISCAVCLAEIQIKDYCRKTICGHYFHKDCIDPWIIKHKNCPMCRQKLTEEDFEKYNQYNEKEIQKKLFENINKCATNIIPIQVQTLQSQESPLNNQVVISISNQQIIKEQFQEEIQQENANSSKINCSKYIQMNDFQVGDVIGNETVFIDQQNIINSECSPKLPPSNHLNISNQHFLSQTLNK